MPPSPVKTAVAVVGNCKVSLSALTKLVDQTDHLNWLNKFYELKAIENEKVIQGETNSTANELTMGEVVARINEITNGEAIVVTDVGQHQMVACRYAEFKQTKSMITSGGLGTMGFCLPAAIGAKFGAQQRQVIAVIGDGGFQMTIQELGTIFQTKIDIKILILNNQFLGMVRQWQDLFFDKRYSSTEMVNPDFQTIAKGYGIASNKVDARANLKDALNTMLNHKGSYLLEVMVGKENNVFPMVETGA